VHPKRSRFIQMDLQVKSHTFELYRTWRSALSDKVLFEMIKSEGKGNQHLLCNTTDLRYEL
jgi:hypothetical protein